jgi:hypothetical protein
MVEKREKHDNRIYNRIHSERNTVEHTVVLRFDHGFYSLIGPVSDIELSQWLSEKMENAKAMNGGWIMFVLHAIEGRVDLRIPISQDQLGPPDVILAQESGDCSRP